MSKILYGFFYLLSLLPLWVLYGIGDILYVFVLIFGYRKSVILNNLKIAFPEKPEKELKKIRRKFYRNFVHTWMETVKFISITEKAMDKMVVADFSLLQRLHDKGHPRITWLSGHFMNWELYGIYPPKYVPYAYLGVYMGITNKPLDDLFIKMRGRSGAVLLRAGHVRTAMLPWRNKEYALVLGADQTPASPKNGVWMNFFSKPTPFLTGPEKSARLGNTPVVFSWMVKKGLGKYEFGIELLVEDPSLLPVNEIQKLYVRKLEEKIRENPDNYLWAHKRWKFEWKPEYEKLWIDDKPMPGGN